MLVNWRTGESVPLSTTGSYVARSCDGLSDFASPFFLPGHLATLGRMLTRGMAVECRRGTLPDQRQLLRVAPNRHIGLLNWFVTGRCNPECAACPEYGERGAGCWAMGWAATGDRLGRDPGACETARRGYRRRLAAVAAAHASTVHDEGQSRRVTN